MMLSLYIHIPFCDKKCSYCNFFALPNKDVDNQIDVDKYVNALNAEIINWGKIFPKEEIKTIYFGGGTPLQIGTRNMHLLIDTIVSTFDISNLEELSIELNPNPYNEVLDFVKSTNQKYKKFFRIRYSFGLQTFDDDILEQTKRGYIYNNLVILLRDLVKLKEANNVFNFDFISFGKFNQNKKGEKMLWDVNRMQFFKNFVSSQFADSFSLYTLELFPGSFMCDFKTVGGKNIDENSIYEEFEILKSIISGAGYKRYEISNFAFVGKESLHNKVYWDMGNYIGMGVNSSSFLKDDYKNIFLKFSNKNDPDSKGVRFCNTTSWTQYFAGNYIDEKTIKIMGKNDLLIEKFFLGLRTSSGIENIFEYTEILVENYKEKIIDFESKGYIKSYGNKIILTDAGMDLYNTIIVELVKEF